MKIDLSEQRATLYRSGIAIAGSRVSTGRHGFPTPVGSFASRKRTKNIVRASTAITCGRRIVKANVDVRKHPVRPVPNSRRAHAVFHALPGFDRMHAGNVPTPPHLRLRATPAAFSARLFSGTSPSALPCEFILSVRPAC